MGVPIPKTGYSDKTAENMIIDAATVVLNPTVNTAKDGFQCDRVIGATSGGVSISIEQNYRYPEIDGLSHLQHKVKGHAILESATATATINLKELSAENLKLALNAVKRAATETEAPTGYEVIETKRYIEEADYIPQVGIIGRMSVSDKPVCFILDNALSTGSMEISTEDNGEAVIEVTLTAHADIEHIETDTFPWRILKLTPVVGG